MPLQPTPHGASKEEREKIRKSNIVAEIRSGRSQKQAVAIAYAEEKRTSGSAPPRQ